MTFKIKACEGDRSENLENIANTIEKMMKDITKLNRTKILGYCQQLKIIAKEIRGYCEHCHSIYDPQDIELNGRCPYCKKEL